MTAPYSFMTPGGSLEGSLRCMFVEAQAEARDPKTPGTLSSSSLFSQMPPDAFEGDQLPTCETTLKIETDTLNPRQCGLRMGKSRREGYGLLGSQGNLPGGGEGGHWNWVLKAEQELTTHTWESYTMG